MSPMQELQNLLENHDWYHFYSDDQNVWYKGNEEKKKMEKLAKEIGPEGEALLKSWQDKKYGK